MAFEDDDFLDVLDEDDLYEEISKLNIFIRKEYDYIYFEIRTC